MAIVKAVNSKASIGKAVDYVTKEEKTEKTLISGIDCSPETAKVEMQTTKEMWNKTGGRQYKHFVHSFPPEEKITPEKAHELTNELCKGRFKGHEVLIATHQDTDHIHSHIIVNSVNHENGYKLQSSKKDLQAMKEYCNELSRANGLSVPEKGDDISVNDMKKYKALENAITGNGKSYVLDCYKAVSEAKSQAISREDFIDMMEQKGFKTTWKDSRKNITFEDKDGHKVRNSNLQKTFDEQFGKEYLERGFEKNAKRKRTKESAERQLRRTNGTDTKVELGDYQATIGEADNATNAETARREAERLEEIRRREQEEREREQKALERSQRSQAIER